VGGVSGPGPLGEDLADDRGIGDPGDDPHRCPAPGARERVHLENPADLVVATPAGDLPAFKAKLRGRNLQGVISRTP